MDVAQPILFFDSGVGGLSVLAPTRRLLPAAPLVYVADNGGFPYGTKTEAEIAARVPALLGRLVERYRPRLVVIACNTASTIALAAVRSALDLPIVGTVPAIKPAAAMSKTRVIGVLGTDATVRQPYVDRLSAEFASDCLVLRHGSARLVELAEAKLRGGAAAPAEYRAALEGLISQPGGDRMDTVVLACTHFPLVEDELRAASPPGLHLMHGASFGGVRAGFASVCLVGPPGAAGLVERAEAKPRGGAAAPAEYRAALEGLISQPGGDRMDTVVLACTHFPLVEDELRAASPQGLHFMHGGDGIARRVQFLTEGQPWPAVAPPGIIVFTRRIDIPPALKQGLGGYGLDQIDYL